VEQRRASAFFDPFTLLSISCRKNKKLRGDSYDSMKNGGGVASVQQSSKKKKKRKGLDFFYVPKSLLFVADCCDSFVCNC
jgi:hypothetical protein